MTKTLTWRTRRAPPRARRAATLVPTRPLATMPSSGKYASEKPGKIAGLAAGASRGNLRADTTREGFDTPLCANACFCGGCDLCFAAMCCPCFLVGANAKMLHSGAYHSPCGDLWQCKRSEECMQFVFPYACIAFWGYWFAPCGPFSFVPGALYTSSFRHKTRKQFGITSSGQCIPGYSNDVFVHLFCFPFALCQEHVELKKNTPFVPLRRLYDDAGERVATGIMDKKKSRKWTFNLDEISDDEDDEGALAERRAERRRQGTIVPPNSTAAMTKDAGGEKHRVAFKQSDIWIDGSCALCGSGPYHNLDRFSDHMVEHTNLRKIHEAIANKTGTVVCNQCKKPFNNVPALGAHRCKPVKGKART